MDNIIDYIKTARELLNDSLKLLNVIENELKSDNMDIKVKEEKFENAKQKIMIMGSTLSNLAERSLKLNSINDKIMSFKTISNSEVIDKNENSRNILNNLDDKILENDNLLEITNLKETHDEGENQLNVDNVKEIDMCNVKIILTDITSDTRYLRSTPTDSNSLEINDPGLVNVDQTMDNIDDDDNKNKNDIDLDDETRISVDNNLQLLNNAAKDEILNDTTSAESGDESNCELSERKKCLPLCNECRVVLYDIAKMGPAFNIDEIQDLRKLEKEVNRLCHIPKYRPRHRHQKRNHSNRDESNEKSIRNNDDDYRTADHVQKTMQNRSYSPQTSPGNIINDKKTLSHVYQSNSEESSSEFSETKSHIPILHTTPLNPHMKDNALSSTDCDSSAESDKSNTVFSNGKIDKSPKNKNQCIVLSEKMDNNSQSEKEYQKKSTKKSKLGRKRKISYNPVSSNDSDSNKSSVNDTKTNNGNDKESVSSNSNKYLSESNSDSSSDASPSDLYKIKSTSSLKKKVLTKSASSKNRKPKSSKKIKVDNSITKPSLAGKRKIKDEEKEEIETRKNIHKILTTSKLSVATKTAAQFESERRKRVEERQKEYNEKAMGDNRSLVPVTEHLILEKDSNGESIVEVSQYILRYLKSHQIDAVKFLWDCVIESSDCLKKSQQEDSGGDKKISAVGGCVMAHCMGLGKTLSLIAFMHTMLTCDAFNLRTCLVLCPVNTALNWKNEWEMWMPPDNAVNVFEVSSSEFKKAKVQIVQEWHAKGGVLIIGYQMYRLLATGDSKTIRRKAIKQKLHEALVNPGPDFVVCDEGHLLKNEKSAISKVIANIVSRRRIVLTGTPLQNRLLEYHTMVQFVKPNLLGTQKEFLNRFVNPIYNGQHINSTPYDVSLMKKRSHILFKTMDGCVHRRDYSALVQYLPPKYEYVIKIRLSDIQIKLYREYLNLCRDVKHSLFQDQMNFSRIWTHPFVICMHQEIIDKKMFFTDTDEDEDVFINDGSDEEFEEKQNYNHQQVVKSSSIDNNDVIDLISDESDEDYIIKKKFTKNDNKTMAKTSDTGSESSGDEVVRNWSTASRSAKRNKLMNSDEEPELIGIKNSSNSITGSSTINNTSEKHWWSSIIQPEHEKQIEISGKLSVLFQILRKSCDIGDKMIIFSQSLLVLDIIEKYLDELHTMAEKVHEDLTKLNGNGEEEGSCIRDEMEGAETGTNNNTFFSDLGYNSWIRGLDYDRMDGSTQAFVRADIQSRFNSSDDRRLRLFLISTRAGGMGVNLVAANRVVIFDVSWNPSHDIQAIFRSYRFGQSKPVYVYRFVSQGTMEEKIYERQVTKQSLSLRVIDEQQISRYFTEEDLKSLYKFEPDVYDPDKIRETPILPKDRLLAELIQEMPQFVHSYHEHDSLLKNKAEEELTESERQEAWREFEEEKERGHRAGFPMNQINQPKIMQNSRMQNLQITMLLQQYPHYATLYAQNYNNLVKYVMSRRPNISPLELNNEVQRVFIQSIEKHFNIQTLGRFIQPREPPTSSSAAASAGTSQSMNQQW